MASNSTGSSGCNGNDNAGHDDNWSIVGGNSSNGNINHRHNKLKRTSSLTAAAAAAVGGSGSATAATNTTVKNLNAPPIPPRRQFSTSKVRRAQSGSVVSLQQQQQQQQSKTNSHSHSNHNHNDTSKPKQPQQQRPTRSQSFSVANGGNRHSINNNGSKNGNVKNKALPIRSTSHGGNSGKPNHSHSKRSLDKVELFTVTTEQVGNTTTGTDNIGNATSILRRSADFLLSFRLLYLEAPTHTSSDVTFTPHNRCDYRLLNNDDRILKIQQEQSLYYNFKPLIVNNQTRFIPKVIQKNSSSPSQSPSSRNDNNNMDSHPHTTQLNSSFTKEYEYTETIAAITSILNKLSWTNLQKLTLKFIEALGSKTTSATTGSNTPNDSTSVIQETTGSDNNGTVDTSGSDVTSNSHGNNSNRNSQSQIIAPELIDITMKIIVDKAMKEMHFAELYAHFAYQLSNIHVKFKRTILRICQEQFEAYTTTAKGDGDSQHSNSSSSNTKKIIALMKFIGELYVKGLIKTSIMIACCESLLSIPESSTSSSSKSGICNAHESSTGISTTATITEYEEKLECFCQLMTTIGQRLEQAATTDETAYTKLWNHVYSVAGRPTPTEVSMVSDDNDPQSASQPQEKLRISTRIKFLLQSLVELKENDWIQIRHVHEKPQTIAEIHEKIQEEMKLGPITRTASSTFMLKRSQSNDTMFLEDDDPSSITAKADVATAVVSKSSPRQRPGKSNLRRTKSEAVPINNAKVAGLSSLQQQEKASTRAIHDVSHQLSPTTPTKKENTCFAKSSFKQKEHFNLTQCSDRTCAVLKEYFVSGDRSEAVSLIAEMVKIHTSGHVQRGTAVLSSGILLVLEMKEVHVRKFLDVVSKCLDDQKIEKSCFIPAILEPFQFLRDIEIDAPQAPKLLAIIIADWLTKKVDDGATPIDSLDFMRMCPENFLKDGDPARFAAQIIKERDGNIKNCDVELVQYLMTKRDLEMFSNGKAFILSFIGA